MVEPQEDRIPQALEEAALFHRIGAVVIGVLALGIGFYMFALSM